MEVVGVDMGFTEEEGNSRDDGGEWEYEDLRADVDETTNSGRGELMVVERVWEGWDGVGDEGSFGGGRGWSKMDGCWSGRREVVFGWKIVVELGGGGGEDGLWEYGGGGRVAVVTVGGGGGDDCVVAGVGETTGQ
ncbi:hypothetical protein L6452_42706 [Arctium lappa]|uniref:Uncharacterized protein n=1 Tax=Arctium lappa TaxID=4217 RepID=A0ACB8XK69_ARCLA|nr:hypothetical protein L6452_42706 [Arctium lappa]